MPSVGRLEQFYLHCEGHIETGVEEGDAISPFYDPMIAKLIAHGDSREKAIDELAAILGDVEVWPVRTNANFLIRALALSEFRSGSLHTGLIAENAEDLTCKQIPDAALLAAV